MVSALMASSSVVAQSGNLYTTDVKPTVDEEIIAQKKFLPPVAFLKTEVSNATVSPSDAVSDPQSGTGVQYTGVGDATDSDSSGGNDFYLPGDGGSSFIMD